MTDASPERSFKFSLRALFVAVAGIAFVLAFWTSLPALSPRWSDLLSRIERASAVPVRDGLHHGKREAFYDWPRPTATTNIVTVALVILFYTAKRLIIRRIDSLDLRLMAYVILVTAVLPFIYLHWTAWPAINVYFLANWINVPIAVLAVPTVSFVLDLRRTHPRSLSRYVWWSLGETTLIIPAWWFVWTIVILSSGLIWI